MGILRGSKQSPTPSLSPRQKWLSQELDKMVISRLFCGKIVLIASKPTLEIREGMVDCANSNHLRFYYYLNDTRFLNKSPDYIYNLHGVCLLSSSTQRL